MRVETVEMTRNGKPSHEVWLLVEKELVEGRGPEVGIVLKCDSADDAHDHALAIEIALGRWI